MKKHDVRPIPNAGYFTAFVHDHGIDCLIRSADWYKLPPIQRYLYNMAASEIRMEDAKTETRVYTFERFERMRLLIEQCEGNEWASAWAARFFWFHPDLAFGVVHLVREGEARGDLLVGDDPDHSVAFGPSDETEVRFAVEFTPPTGVERSEA